MKIKELLNFIKKEHINTWFDLGLFIDRLKENRKIPSAEFLGFYEDYYQSIKTGGIAFITFDYGIDGVSIEARKYAQCFRNFVNKIPIHFIAGEFFPESKNIIDPSYHKLKLDELYSFNKWPLFDSFFLTKLERGSPEYNALIHRFWNEVQIIVEKLGSYLLNNEIKLLCLFNVCSNPGNLSLSLAIVLISEFFGIPVINNCHDYYWEGGNREIDIKNKNLNPGPRDLFFKNSDIGEIFTILEMLLPWESRSWITVNINKNQSNRIIEIKGHNPANVFEINTSIDINSYQNIPKQFKIKALKQIADILSRYTKYLKVYTPSQILEDKFISQNSLKPILIGSKESKSFDFVNNNVIFLQPTRIMQRKRIEIGFDLVKKLFSYENFASKFEENPSLRLTLLISGPLAQGQFNYLIKLIQQFDNLLKKLSTKYREKVYLAFLFSESDKKKFIDKYNIPLTIQEIYNIASLILFPSETEGRGLPIIEAAACGIPIIANRYYPINVFEEVVGKNLNEKYRLKILEFENHNIKPKLIKKITESIFFPQKFIEEIKHNKEVVKRRYSVESLEKNIQQIFFRLYGQLKPNNFNIQRVAYTLKEYKKLINYKNKYLQEILNTKNRTYIAGYGKLHFMIFLKSLIDPSYFRVEEQRIRGLIMKFAKKLTKQTTKINVTNKENLIHFYNSVDNIFNFHNDKISIRHDHSLPYRHRNKNYYPYQDFTFQELTGLINMLFNKIFSPQPSTVFGEISHLFTDLYLALFQLTNSSSLLIDDRKKLIDKLKTNIPFALFPGNYIKNELDFFAVQHIRMQLALNWDDILTENIILKNHLSISPIYIFCPEKPLGKNFTAKTLENYIKNSDDSELQLLIKYGLIKIIKTKQYCIGIHFPQLGTNALKILRKIQQEKGCIIACKPQASLMTDIIDIDRFHIGNIKNELSSKMMGIPINSGYIQFVPAGIRTTLAYPTPIQTSFDFSKEIKGDLFKKLSKKYGEKKIFSLMKKEAEINGSPVKEFLKNLNEQNDHNKSKAISFSYVCGKYEDNNSWSGVIANANVSNTSHKWNFIAVNSKKKKKVTEFIYDYQKKHEKKIHIAWNGGYMLNAELVGKLGLPESYIGTPLGLIISQGNIICPPLFNKPAFIINSNGTFDIKRVNCKNGFTISDDNKIFNFKSDNYNNENPKKDELCFYDLLYQNDVIYGNGRVIVRLAGNTIKEIIYTKKNQNIPVLPVGLCLSLPLSIFPKNWKTEKSLKIIMQNFSNIKNAIEAGPMLLSKNKCCIDMEKEGWKTSNSIKTQAARLDFLDMRGPKIAIGIDKLDNLSILAINGRIRESVGATHLDMANILRKKGIIKAMGFDPGGSSTLFACNEILNISPFNSEYEKEMLSLPPEPRPVGNAILGWYE